MTPPKDKPTITALQHRVDTLVHELNRRPTPEQVAYITDYARRQKKLYEAVLARNVILKRRLDEAQNSCHTSS